MRLANISSFSFAVALLTTGFSSVFGAVTEPVGALAVDCPNGSDTILSLPFHKSAVYQGVVDSVSGSNITFQGSPGFTVDEYVSGIPHFALVFSGALEGLVLPITSNTSDTVTVDVGGEDISVIVSDDDIRIIPFTTLENLIGNSGPDGLQILAYNMDVAGVNLSASVLYTHYNSFGWYDGGTYADDDIIYPGEAFILRNQSGSDYELTFSGNVLACDFRHYFRTLSSDVNQDNHIGFSVPDDTMIGDASIGYDLDQLLVFDNTTAALNKSAQRLLTYYDGFGWYDGGTRVDDPGDPGNNFYLKAGEGYVYRKQSSVSPSYFEWVTTPTYLPF